VAEFVAILDFGSQYTQLIARRVRENRVYCEILKFDTSPEKLASLPLRGIILSGGPSGVYEAEAPRCHPGIFEIGVPILGICYGMQLGGEILGGRVVPAPDRREYGEATLEITGDDDLFHGLRQEITVWMSHGDRVDDLPASFETVARSENCPHAAIRHADTGFRGIQFHPEVTHTPDGRKILQNFLYRVCGCAGDWSLSRFTEEKIAELKETLGDARVVCGLSGGVDSSVVALLLHRAIGDRLHCILVDNGVLRSGEKEEVVDTFQSHFKLDLRVAESTEIFLDALRGVTDPEEKRKVIGHTFIDVFKNEAQDLQDFEGLGGLKYLAQGTLYPDVIESISPLGGPSATIKSHHNVGGLPEELGFDLVEPLRFLFKDEVRLIGKELGLPDEIVHRQPFPGPGLAIRVIGEVTAERLKILREADSIVCEEMERLESYRDVWQSFAVLLPTKTVGVMGDQRTYEHVIALRIVESTDGMTANWVYLPRDIISRISGRICNEVSGVNRVVLDVSSKPPSTIEWE
jgi:GMP synthase (glutamine-hydrolysing)